MLWSKLFIPTLREDPAGVESVARRWLVRAGYIREAGLGGYAHLFPAQRCLLKITGILRREMDFIGAQEMRTPGHNLWAFARELRSYKQLPQIWYQIKQGNLNSYSFDLDEQGSTEVFLKHCEVYGRILKRCGVDARALGSRWRDFMVESKDGADFLVVCPQCGEAANLRKAVARPAARLAADPEGAFACEEFHTPGRKTIAEIAEFTGLPETSQIKSLVMNADGKPVLALVRGDHQLSNAKLAEALGGAVVMRPAQPDEIREWFGASAGSLGPVGVTGVRVLADEALLGRRNMIAGANRDDYHLCNVTPGKDFTAEFHNLREAAAGDGCVNCGAAVEVRHASQLGNVARLGPKYAESTGLRVWDRAGKDVPPVMGSSNLWIERILNCAVEQNHDGDGMMLPAAIAPFTVVITPIYFADAQQRAAAESIYRDCLSAGIDALLDDRDERPGVKFKDADLIGIPWRVVVGKKAPLGLVELVERRGKRSNEVAVAEAAGLVGQATRACPK